MTLEEKLDYLRGSDRTAEAVAERRAYHSETEVGIAHASGRSGIHLRDDDTVEIFAGATRLLLDGAHGMVVLSGNDLLLAGNALALEASRGVALNGQPLGAWLYPSPPGAPFRTAEVYGLFPEACALVPGHSGVLDQPIFQGPSAPPTSLRQLGVEVKPLFEPAKPLTVLGKTLTELLQEVSGAH